MPQVGTVTVTVTFTPATDADVTHHEVRLRPVGAQWEPLTQNTPNPTANSAVFTGVPQLDVDHSVVAEVRAWDAGAHASAWAENVFVIAAGDPPPSAPSDVSATVS